MKNIGLMGWGIIASAIQIAAGCSSEVQPKAGEKSGEKCAAGESGCTDSSNSNASSAPSPSQMGAAGAGPSTNVDTNSRTPKGGGTSSSSGTSSMASDVPCDVATVVGTQCGQCHGEQPKFGAPMPLTKLADFHAAAKSDPRRKVFEVIPERINAQDPTRRMPPASSPPLGKTQLEMLSAWASAGAKANVSKDACANTAGQGSVDPTAGGTPIDYNDPEMKCYRFTAHAPNDKATAYSVGTTPDTYTGFTFMPPWKGMMYARSFKAIIDNGKVIHHWLFFRNGAAGKDGEVAAQSGAHPDGSLVHGWAPGGNDLYLEPNVGEEMPSDVSYTLEAHYNNTGGAPTPDASGVEVCVTPKVPDNVASISWLGTDLIAGTTAEGTCAPRSNKPITIIGATPHMHVKGRHMKIVINRKGGGQETINDHDFDFQYQRSYQFKHMLMPGDTISTSCTYSEPSSYGRGTNDEMCYAFTLYYPKLALTNGDLLGSTLHGPDTCLPLSDGGALSGGLSGGDNGDNLIPGVDIPGIPGI